MPDVAMLLFDNQKMPGPIPMSEKPTRPLKGILAQDSPSLGPLLTHAATLQRLNGLVHARLPSPLSAHCRVGNYKGGILIIHVGSATWASKLRYLIPDLRQALATHGEFQGLVEIRLRTIADPSTPPNPARRPRMPKEAAVLLNSLAERISSKGLAAALRRLARNASEGEGKP